jgi:hypothetical protein
MLRMCVCMHSRFVENHPIWILEDGLLISKVVLSKLLSLEPSFLCEMCVTVPTTAEQEHTGQTVTYPH